MVDFETSLLYSIHFDVCYSGEKTKVAQIKCNDRAKLPEIPNFVNRSKKIRSISEGSK